LHGVASRWVVCGFVSWVAAAEHALNLNSSQKHTGYQSMMHEKGTDYSVRAPIGPKVRHP